MAMTVAAGTMANELSKDLPPLPCPSSLPALASSPEADAVPDVAAVDMTAAVPAAKSSAVEDTFSLSALLVAPVPPPTLRLL